MADRTVLTFWNYNAFSGYKPEMLKDWANCGMTDPITPLFSLKRDDHAKFHEMLDDAEKLGVRLILQIDEIFLDHALESGYKETVEDVVREFGSHPSTLGYYVGEEPDARTSENYKKGIRTIRDAAPDARIYVNLGSTERTDRMLLSKTGETLDEWCADIAGKSGGDIIGYGTYSQMIDGGSGLDDHFYNLRVFTEIGKKTGTDIWATMLSSAHYNFRIPTEEDYRWQLNTCVACGCKGVVWFRLYDKLVAGDYRGSPIDEFGEKTSHYYDLARVQKKFNFHYGKLFARLHHINSAGLGTSYGGYYYFLPGASDLVKHASSCSAMLSFFKDDDGNDYLVVINTFQREATPVVLSFTDKVAKAEHVYQNGEDIRTAYDLRAGDKPGDLMEIWLAPGQMDVLKLEVVK